MAKKPQTISSKAKKQLLVRCGWLTIGFLMLGSSIFVPLGIQGSNRTLLVITGILFFIAFFLSSFPCYLALDENRKANKSKA